MQPLIFLFCLASASVLATEYKYVSYGAPDFYNQGRESFRLDTANNEMISGDAIESIVVCDDKSKFHCFHNLAVSFYVPKTGVAVGQSWDGNGLTFRVIREERVEVFGTVKTVVVIEAKRADRVDYFYYSPSDGLMAIKHVSEKGMPTQFFMVAGRTGFPR